MQRIVEYRGFEIHVELVSTSKDMFDVWFRIEGTTKPPGVAAIGERIKVRGGPFSRRWAYLVAEIVGQAAIDVILGVTEERLIAEQSDARGELVARLGSNAFVAARDSSKKTSVEMDMAKGKEVFASHKGFVIRVLAVPELSTPSGCAFRVRWVRRSSRSRHSRGRAKDELFSPCSRVSVGRSGGTGWLC